MTLHKCPRCNQNYVTDPFCTDGEHQCSSGNPVLDQEDVRKLGNWDDGNGNTGSVNKHEMQNVPDNKQMFNDGWIRDREVVGEFTVRGKPAEHMRQRQHIEFIEIPKD